MNIVEDYKKAKDDYQTGNTTTSLFGSTNKIHTPLCMYKEGIKYTDNGLRSLFNQMRSGFGLMMPPRDPVFTDVEIVGGFEIITPNNTWKLLVTFDNYYYSHIFEGPIGFYNNDEIYNSEDYSDKIIFTNHTTSCAFMRHVGFKYNESLFNQCVIELIVRGDDSFTTSVNGVKTVFKRISDDYIIDKFKDKFIYTADSSCIDRFTDLSKYLF